MRRFAKIRLTKLRSIFALMHHIGSKALLSALGFIERIGGDGSAAPLPQVPIFIIGAPRCGSTLLYQCMTQMFNLGYLSNRHIEFYTAPALVQKLAPVIQGSSSYKSNLGRTEQFWEPHEAGRYFYRFFPRHPQYVSAHDFKEDDRWAFRASLRKLGNAFGRPLLFKNMHCALRIQAVSQASPEAVYIVVERDLTETAASILRARQLYYGSEEKWWSMEPPGYEELLSLSPEKQVVEQVRSIYELIERDLSAVDPERIIRVQYERLCHCPEDVMEELQMFLKHLGVQLIPRSTIPKQFVKEPKRDDVYRRVQEEVNA